MKKKKTLWILCIVLILLILVYILIMRENKKQNTENIDQTAIQEEETKPILALNKGDIIKLSYTKEENSMTFQRQEDIWIYEPQSDFPIHQSYINNMINIFTDLRSTQVIKETTENLKEYGLEQPAYRITATTSDGTQTTVLIGMKNPVTSDYYVSIEGAEGIYTISKEIAGYFDYSLYDMAKADTFPTIDTATVSEMSFYWKGEDVVLKIVEDSNYKKSDFTNWYVTDAFEHEITADVTLIDTQLKSIADLIYTRLAVFKPSEEQLEEMGLTNPTGKISFAYTEAIEETTETQLEETEAATELETMIVPKTYTMLIGNKNGEDYYYAMEEGSDKVNLISASAIENVMSYTANDYVYKYFALIDIEAIDSITLESDGDTYTLKNLPKTKKTESEEETSQISEEEETREAEIRSLYQSIINLHAEQVIDKVQEEQEWLNFSIIWNKKEEEQDIVVKFASYDNNFYLAAVNEEACYLVNKRDFEKYKSTILEGFQKFSE